MTINNQSSLNLVHRWITENHCNNYPAARLPDCIIVLIDNGAGQWVRFTVHNLREAREALGY